MNGSEKQSQNRGTCCWGARPWTHCYPDFDNPVFGGFGNTDMQSIMEKGFWCCRYFLLVPLILGLTLLLFGYFLSPETIRVLWKIGITLAVGMGFLYALP